MSSIHLTNPKDIKALYARQEMLLSEMLERELSSLQKKVFCEIILNGKTQAAVAAEMGVNKSTVCRCLKRAVRNLQKIMDYQDLIFAQTPEQFNEQLSIFVEKELPPVQRQAFQATIVDGKTQSAFAKTRNVNKSTTCRTVQRALAKIDTVLKYRDLMKKHHP